jgi:hypothetical protein
MTVLLECAKTTGIKIRGSFVQTLQSKNDIRRKKMSYLKKENLDKCFSLLREYLNEEPSNHKQGVAILALNQLQKITAGTDDLDIPLGSGSSGYSYISCNGRPRADS